MVRFLPRFTVRRLMVAVAIVAVLIAWCVENVNWRAFSEPSNPAPVMDHWPVEPDPPESE